MVFKEANKAEARRASQRRNRYPQSGYQLRILHFRFPTPASNLNIKDKQSCQQRPQLPIHVIKHLDTIQRAFYHCCHGGTSEPHSRSLAPPPNPNSLQRRREEFYHQFYPEPLVLLQCCERNQQIHLSCRHFTIVFSRRFPHNAPATSAAEEPLKLITPMMPPR